MAEPVAQVAALLLNWRRADLTLACLRALLASSQQPLRVLVLDNGSAAGRGGVADAAALQQGIARLGSTAPHRVELLALPQNLGFAGGMNRGIEWATAQACPYTLVLNNDLELAPGWLEPLLLLLRQVPQVVAVGPTVLRPDGRVWAEGGALACRPNALVLNGHGRLPTPVDHGPVEVAFLPGACVLFRTAALAAVGGFDARYFMYWEDVDLCVRLAARGGRIVWLPWTRVVHAAGQSSGGGRSPLRKFLMANNAVRFLRTHGGLAAGLGWLLFDVLLWPLSLLQGPRVAWAKLRGTLRGLAGRAATAQDVEDYLAAASKRG